MASDSDSECGLGDMGFMFDNEQPTVLETYTFPPSISVSMNVVDDDPGAVISGHYLWPASHLMAKVRGCENRFKGEVMPIAAANSNNSF